MSKQKETVCMTSPCLFQFVTDSPKTGMKQQLGKTWNDMCIWAKELVHQYPVAKSLIILTTNRTALVEGGEGKHTYIVYQNGLTAIFPPEVKSNNALPWLKEANESY